MFGSNILPYLSVAWSNVGTLIPVVIVLKVSGRDAKATPSAGNCLRGNVIALVTSISGPMGAIFISDVARYSAIS